MGDVRRRVLFPTVWVVFVFAVHLIGHSGAQTLPHELDLNLGDACTLSDGRNGTCYELKYCSLIKNELTNRRIELNRLVKCKSFMRNGRWIPLFCCPMSRAIPTTTTTPAPTALPEELAAALPVPDDQEVGCAPNTNSQQDTANWQWQCINGFWSFVRKTDEERKSQKACAEYQKQVSTKFTFYGASFASLGEFPHMAALGSYNDSTKEYPVFKCDGSLISNRYILSTAKCFGGVRPVFARLGAVDVDFYDNEFPYADYDFENVIFHPDYANDKAYHDLSLIRLNQDVAFTDIILPACLSSDTRTYPETTETYATGWGIGSMNADSEDNELIKTKLTIMTLEQCAQGLSDAMNFSSYYPDGLVVSQICAKDLSSIENACHGVSGGPVQIVSRGKVSTLFGVTSFGVACSVSAFTVYTRISSHLDWIESFVWPNI